MNNSKLVSVLMLIIIIVVSGFFFMNNIMHIGFHVGHDHHGEEEMKGEHGDSVEGFEISPGEVVEKIKNGDDIVILDVRTPEEYAEIHLENSLLLPVGELSANTLESIGLGESAKDKEIIIYCRSGSRSKQAYDIMNSLGYTKIKSVAGGMVHWQEDGYPFTEVGEYDGDNVMNKEVGGVGPEISFDRDVHDFGLVPQSQGVVSTTFEVRNGGDDVLKIGELSTSCGCTSAEISQTSIESGDIAILTVSFDPDFHDEPSGQITRTVFIPTNVSGQNEVEVKIKVDIIEE